MGKEKEVKEHHVLEVNKNDLLSFLNLVMIKGVNSHNEARDKLHISKESWFTDLLDKIGYILIRIYLYK